MPAAGSVFAGWSGGGCTGVGACTVPVTGAMNVSAAFTLTTHLLTVARAGTGSGSVTSTPAGISCGAGCTASYDYGTSVVLSAAASTGSSFTGWSEPTCPGTGPCTVSVTAATTVTATFSLENYVLTVARAGTGTGTVVSNVAGINCGSDCTETFSWGTVVQLTATAAGNSGFSGWTGGGCSGTGTCTTTVSAASTVTASFGLISRIGNYTQYAGSSGNLANYLGGEQFVVPSPVILRKLGLIAISGGPQVKMALYADVANAPGALIAQTASTPMVAGTMEMDTTGGFIALPAGTYWIMAVSSASASVGYLSSGASNLTIFAPQPFASPLPNPYGSAVGGPGQSFNYYVVVH
jgi:hypothetical protein